MWNKIRRIEHINQYLSSGTHIALEFVRAQAFVTRLLNWIILSGNILVRKPIGLKERPFLSFTSIHLRALLNKSTEAFLLLSTVQTSHALNILYVQGVLWKIGSLIATTFFDLKIL